MALDDMTQGDYVTGADIFSCIEIFDIDKMFMKIDGRLKSKIFNFGSIFGSQLAKHCCV
jgi:hypothetical protein